MAARRKHVWLIIGIVLAFYVFGYIDARRNHRVVHYVSYAGEEYTLHDVSGGDAALFGALLNARVAAFYTPLRYVEIGWWYLRHPVGSPLSDVHKQRLK